MKKFSTSLVIKEKRVKTTLRFCLIPVGMAITINAGEDVVKQKSLHTAGGNAN
jgi:hypothetical protein